MRAKSLQSCLTLLDPMDGSSQAPLSMEFFRQEYWSGLPCPPPGDLPHPEMLLMSPALQADSLPSKPPEKPHIYSEQVINIKYKNNNDTTTC